MGTMLTVMVLMPDANALLCDMLLYVKDIPTTWRGSDASGTPSIEFDVEG